jgi:hypothetical protein
MGGASGLPSALALPPALVNNYANGIAFGAFRASKCTTIFDEIRNG